MQASAIADDGARIYLDGKLIAEDLTDHAPTAVTGEVTAAWPVAVATNSAVGSDDKSDSDGSRFTAT